MNGLLAPLTTKEEIALRRVANDAFTIDPASKKRLQGLALIEVTARTMRLTPLGQKRYDSLAKAPLVAGRRSVNASLNYIESVLEKAEALRASRTAKATQALCAIGPSSLTSRLSPEVKPAGDRRAFVPSAAPLVPADRLVEVQYSHELRQLLAQAHSSLAILRKHMTTHRQDHVRRVDASQGCLAASRLLLNRTVPAVPA